MSAPQIITYRDAIDAAVDFLSGNAGSAASKDVRRCVHSALREVTDANDWSFLHKHGRIHLHAAETCTITYDHTGGTVERKLTIGTGSWPSWAVDAVVRIGDVVSYVATRESATVLTLDSVLNPGADIAAGTSCTIYPNYYALPTDFRSFDGPWGENSWSLGIGLSPSEMMAMDRFESSTGTIAYYCVRAIDDLIGTLGLFIAPASDADETIDFLYSRRPRQLRYSGHDTVDTAGTISVTAGSAAVTGSGTHFETRMIGSVLRVGQDTTHIPEGLSGQYPFDDERTIIAVTGATAATLDANIVTARSAVKYCISDPIDIDSSAQNAFFRCLEKHLAIARNMKTKAEAIQLYNEALFLAKGGDNHDRSRRVAHVGGYRGFLKPPMLLGTIDV